MKNDKDVVTKTYVIDDSSIYAKIDEKLANMDTGILNKAKQEDGNNKIIDKAIKERKRREKGNKSNGRIGLLVFLSELSNNSKVKPKEVYLMSNEREEVNKGSYEEHNFEEEELEDDDYYNEDLD